MRAADVGCIGESGVGVGVGVVVRPTFIMPNAQCPDFCHWPEYEGIGLPRATRLLTSSTSSSILYSRNAKFSEHDVSARILVTLSREQNGRDKIDGQSRPREPRTWALGKVDRDEQERSLSDTLKRPPRLSLARSTTSKEQRHKRQQRRDRLEETSAALRDSAACYREVSENCHWPCE